MIRFFECEMHGGDPYTLGSSRRGYCERIDARPGTGGPTYLLPILRPKPTFNLYSYYTPLLTDSKKKRPSFVTDEYYKCGMCRYIDTDEYPNNKQLKAAIKKLLKWQRRKWRKYQANYSQDGIFRKDFG